VREFVESFGACCPSVDPFSQRVGLARRHASGFRHLAERAARAIRDDVRNLCGAIAPVALVHVLDHLFPALVLDVEVDVGRAVAFG